ncbi:MAG: hypothetical protein H6817_02875 [Phycisphaerales bacterium]|nr:hypothetical protein [Phycisphaerales bacterium]
MRLSTNYVIAQTLCFVVALVMHASACVAAQDALPISFQLDNGWVYDGRIELPDAAVRRPWAVMLLGGGLGTAIDWHAPGIMTIDGKETRDGDTIADAFRDRGFVVMRWHAIRRDDPLYAKDQFMMDVPTPAQTVEQARKAMVEFRKAKVVPDDHIFLLGHSLGAARAAALVDEHKDCPGVVMLAGASLIPSKLDVARKLLADADNADFDGIELTADERQAYRLRVLRDHRDAWSVPIEGTTRLGSPWPVDVLLRQRTPTLLMVGELDERWLTESYLVTDYLRRGKHPDYTWKVWAGIGHQLGPEQPGDVTYGDYGVIAKSRSGPIDADVVRTAVDWIDQHAK